MSDPFERLSRTVDYSPSPDISAIKSRAHGIRRRRQLMVSGTAAAIAVIAVAGIMLGTSPSRTTSDLAQQELQTSPSPSSVEGTSAPLAAVTLEDSGEQAARSSAGAGTTSAGKGVAGERAPSGGAATSADTTAAAPARGGATVQELEATLEIEDQSIGRGKTFTLKVCNTTSGTVKREFGTSQRYDFEVKRDGELVWRWSDGQAFTQVVGEETWKAKECKTWSEAWDATNSEGMPVPSGDYAAAGILKTSPELRTKGEPFSVSAL